MTKRNRIVWMMTGVLALGAAAGCGQEEPTPVPVQDNDDNNDTPQGQALKPSFELGQTWVVGSIYRSTSVKTPEDALAIPTAVAADTIEIEPLIPAEVLPADGTSWTTPVFWRFGVINTNYRPETGPFAELALDEAGEIQPITILKAVAPKELNDKGIVDGLDPVFYLVLRESDYRVKGIHYNYKVRDGRNTVVLEMPELEAGTKGPGADLDFFLVDYMMPIFPMTAADATVAYGAEGAGLEMVVRKRADDSAEVEFKTAIDRKSVTQRWTAGAPWFDWSISESQRSWTVDEAALLDLLEANGVDYYSNDQFLEQAEAIERKFRNRINVGAALRVEAGTFNSRTPDSHLPWAGYWFPLVDSATTFGWNGTNGRRQLTTGPATSLQAAIKVDLGKIDLLLKEIIAMPRDAQGRDAKLQEYWKQKDDVSKKIRDHFEHPETGVAAKYRAGTLTLNDINSFGPLEKFGLYLLANKLSDHPFEAAIWEITKQYNPEGDSWWGKCNGWAAASVLTNEPRQSVTVQLDTANITGQAGTLNLDFTTGDLKSLSASSYYGTRSHFYGQRFYGKDDDRGNNTQDIAADVFHRVINFYIGQEKFPMVFDLTSNEQVWNYSCYAFDSQIGALTTLDAGTKGVNLATKAELEAGGISKEAAAAIFDRVRSTKGAFATFAEVEELEAVSAEDVSKLRAASFTLWGERRAHQVTTNLKCATDGVSEDHIDTLGADPRGFTKNYTYNLVASASGTITRGEWTGASIEDHPDFAWVPYANEVRRSDNQDARRFNSYADYVKDTYFGRFAPSENAFLYTDVLEQLIDVRTNAPVVCNPDPDDCGEGLKCNPVDGTCSPIGDVNDPEPIVGCIGAETQQGAGVQIAGGKVCAGRDSWFAIALTEGQKAEVVVTFTHADGDIDIALHDPAGRRVMASESTSDMESVTWTANVAGNHLLRVFGYSGAENTVNITVNISQNATPACAEEGGEPNNNIQSATPVVAGTHSGAVCGSDSDFYRVNVQGSWTVTVTFVHTAGDLDLKSFDSAGKQLLVSQGTTNTETVTGSGPGFVQVYGYDNAAGPYTLTVR